MGIFYVFSRFHFFHITCFLTNSTCTFWGLESPFFVLEFSVFRKLLEKFLPHSHTSAHAISKTRVVCGTPEILYSVLPHLLQIHSLSTVLITFFIFTLMNCSVTLYSTLYLLFLFYIVTFGFHVPVTSLILQKIV